MKIQSLGHVVIKVRNLEHSERFYAGLLGLPVCARFEERKMVFFSLGNHHDFAIAEMGDDAPSPPENAVGLAHVAFCIGDQDEQLKDALTRLRDNGIEPRAIDHEVSHSLYFPDPDGNVVELYIDSSDVWKSDPQTVAQSRPLKIAQA